MYLLNVYSIVKEQVRGFCPSSGRSRERAKIKPPEKFLKNFFTGSSFEHSSLEYRKTKKAQLPQWVTGPQPSVYGINGNKLRQKDSKQNKDTGRKKLPLDVRLKGAEWREIFPYFLTHSSLQTRFSPMVNPLKMG
jgi:hypothetical protein